MSTPTRQSLSRTWIDSFLGRGPESNLDRFLIGTPVYRPLETATEFVKLSGRVLRQVFTPPFSYTREAIIESSRALAVVTIPMVFASLVYVLAFGSVLFAQVVYALGAPDRLGPGFYLGLLRELSTWLTMMVLAGVVGSALCGDIGARRIRGELDALDVLGVDTLRTLIVPRVVAITVVGVLLSLLVVLIDLVCMVWLDTYTVDQNFKTQFEAIFLVMNPYDIGAAVLKHTILGFFIGIVACQKGFSARGGAEGVGRAVNESVVITFFGIWLINSLFNTGYLTFVPEAIAIKG